MSTLAELLTGFEATFQGKHSYAGKHPSPIGESLAALRGKLDEVEKKLKQDIGGWLN